MKKYYVSNERKGWRGSSGRHALAARGISTGRKPRTTHKFSTADLMSLRQNIQAEQGASTEIKERILPAPEDTDEAK